MHVHPGAEELGRVYRPHLAINAAPTAFAAALEGLQPPNEIPWRARDQDRARRLSRLDRDARPPQPGGVNFGEIMVWLRENLPADAILINGAGNFATWVHRFFRFRRFGQHIAPTSGSMGYGVPAAVAMKRLYPERTVVCIAGDGDFLMNGQEFTTAVQYDLPIIVRDRRQRHLRHHPHAPGARISRPRGRRPSCGIRISPPTRAPSAASA